jgi:hypothetical protein
VFVWKNRTSGAALARRAGGGLQIYGKWKRVVMALSWSTPGKNSHAASSANGRGPSLCSERCAHAPRDRSERTAKAQRYGEWALQLDRRLAAYPSRPPPPSHRIIPSTLLCAIRQLQWTGHMCFISRRRDRWKDFYRSVSLLLPLPSVYPFVSTVLRRSQWTGPRL